MSRFRGYIFSRPFMGERVPQHVQNLVIRDYCKKQGIQYLLSATEYALADSYLILQQVLDDLSQLDGIVFYSLFLLPEQKLERDRVTHIILDNNKEYIPTQAPTSKTIFGEYLKLSFHKVIIRSTVFVSPPLSGLSS